jgi:hypothetical protein
MMTILLQRIIEPTIKWSDLSLWRRIVIICLSTYKKNTIYFILGITRRTVLLKQEIRSRLSPMFGYMLHLMIKYAIFIYNSKVVNTSMNKLKWWKVIVRVVDIGGVVDYHCSTFFL